MDDEQGGPVAVGGVARPPHGLIGSARAVDADHDAARSRRRRRRRGAHDDDGARAPADDGTGGAAEPERRRTVVAARPDDEQVGAVGGTDASTPAGGPGGELGVDVQLRPAGERDGRRLADCLLDDVDHPCSGLAADRRHGASIGSVVGADDAQAGTRSRRGIRRPGDCVPARRAAVEADDNGWFVRRSHALIVAPPIDHQ